MSNINFKVIGGGREIGANSYLLEWNDKKILLDCGKHPLREDMSSMPQVEHIGGKLDAIVISHTHNDHIGALPYIVKNFPDVPIYMTKPAYDMLGVVLKDTIKLINRKNRSDLYSFEELYKEKEVIDNIEENIILVDYDEEIDFFGLKLKMLDAGHILGSAMIKIWDDEFSVLYTGDVRISKFITTCGVNEKEVGKADILIMEGTYGASNKINSIDLKDVEDRFLKSVMKTVQDGGKILMPAFAQGRTQDLLIYLNKVLKENNIKVPIECFGLGTKINKVYLDNAKYLNSGCDISILNKYTSMREDWEDVLLDRSPKIIIATNGMIEYGTYSYELAKQMIEDDSNLIIFTGYLDDNSFAKKLKNAGRGGRIEFFDGETKEIKCRIEEYSFSAHSSQLELVYFVDKINPQNVILVHGDENALIKLSGLIKGRDVKVPYLAEKIIIKKGENRNLLSIVNTSSKRAVIVTVGTSIISNYNRIAKKSIDCNKEDVYRYYGEIINYIDKEDNRELIMKLSAEANTLERIEMDCKKDVMYLITSKTKDAQFCADILKYYYEKKKFECEKVIVEKLTKDYKTFMDEGLPEFVNKVIDRIQEHRNNAIIVATGGFKAETAYATIIGFLTKCEVKYIHDDFKNVVDIPSISVGVDFMEYEQNAEIFARILMSKNFAEAGAYYNNLPEKLKKFLIKYDKLKKYYWSPLGLMVARTFFPWKMEVMKKDTDVKVINKKNLWNKKIKNINDIPDRNFRKVIESLILENSNLIKAIEFEDIDKRDITKKIIFETESIGSGFVKLKLRSEDGAQIIKVITYPEVEDVLWKRLKNLKLKFSFK